MTDISQQASALLVERLRSGDVRALARAVSLVENGAPESAELLAACFPATGRGLRIGVTGAPGAGKSTLVDRLARSFRDAGQAVGIVAVDPTSPFTGGAILGDRIRMQAGLNGADAGGRGIYVRSMATRGALGGVAGTTADVASVIEASGRDPVLVETVGVGQDEIDIVRLADITIVVLVPGMGDDVQSLKAGVMEIADIFVINKSDRDGADRVEKEIRAMQSLAGSHGDWIPPVIKTVATTSGGTDRLIAAIEDMRAWLSEQDRLFLRRKTYWRQRIDSMVQQSLLREARRHGLSVEQLDSSAERVARGEENPYRLVSQMTTQLFTAQPAPAITIDHLGIAVASIAAARGFYETLGLNIAHEETVDHERVRVAMIPAGDSRIELLEPLASDSPIGKFIAKRGEGLHHVALNVEDIAAALAALKQKGVRLISEEVQIGAGGHLYFFVHPSSAGGVLLEICQDRVTNE
jgi:LAO/AO transport system kinase